MEKQNLLYLMRHGVAEAHANQDSERSLTPAGKLEVVRVVGKLKKLVNNISCILSSPYKRAQQTAAVVAEGFEVSLKEIKSIKQLMPESDPEEAFYSILPYLKESHTICVAHQPLLGRLIYELCGDVPSQLAVDTADIFCIRLFEQQCNRSAQFVWHQKSIDG